MTYKVDFIDGAVLKWSLTADGVTVERDEEYTPTVYAGIRDGNLTTLRKFRGVLESDPKVVETSWEEWNTSLRKGSREEILRIDLERISEIRSLEREVRTLHEPGELAPGTIELYNTDFSPQFRYCLENELDPTPEYRLTKLHLDISEKGLADQDLSQLRIEEEPLQGGDRAILETVGERLERLTPTCSCSATAR